MTVGSILWFVFVVPTYGVPMNLGTYTAAFGFALAIVLTSAMGAVLRTRAQGNPIAWVFFVSSLGLLLTVSASALITREAPPTAPSFWHYAALVFLSSMSNLTMFYPMLLLLYVFPTGHFLSRRWRWSGWFGAVVTPVLFVTSLFGAELGIASFEGGTWVLDNPTGFIPRSIFETVAAIVQLGLLVVALGGAAAIVVRYRRASPVVRAQIKWLVYPGLLLALSFMTMATGAVASGTALFISLFVTPLCLIPITITIAITRYRLFEIDRLISRTVGYGLVVATLGLVYAAGAVWLPAQLTGEQSPVFVAGSTLAVAALFNPVRRRIVQWVDRRFYRSRYHSGRVVEEFGRGLNDEVDVARLTDGLIAVAIETMRPSSASAWIRAG